MEKLRIFFSEASFVHPNWVEPQARPGQPIYPNGLWLSLIEILMDLRLLVDLMLVCPSIHKLIRAVVAMFTSAFPDPAINICT